MNRERWQSIPTLTSRESKGQVLYPREFWLVQHVEPTASRGLRTVIAWAAFFFVIAVWSFALFGGF